MSRMITVLIAFISILAAFFGLSAAAYGLGSIAEGLFEGGSRITNILLLMLVGVMILATLLTIAERKWSAMMQNRVGPNRARINLPGLRNRALGGIPHVIADALKMLFKEDFSPRSANPILFNLGPVLAFAPAFVLFAVVPVGPEVAVLGKQVALMVTNPDFGILYVFAIASLAVYGTSLAGWASNNKFALLGGVRASSQMISYEVALGLSLVGIMMAFSSVQLPAINEAQFRYLWQMPGSDLGLPAWGIFLQPVGFVLFFAAAFAETKRAPFDVPEGESEIIGYFVEYSGLKFGMFMISEFVEVVVLAAVTVTLFLGGYHLPFGETWLYARPVFVENPWLLGAFAGTVFWVKTLLLCWVQLAIRWTFPRFRYDQIQTLGWKMLLPAGLVNVFLTGALVLWDPSLRALAVVGILQIGIVIAMTLGKAGAPETSHGSHDAHAQPASLAHPH